MDYTNQLNTIIGILRTISDYIRYVAYVGVVLIVLNIIKGV